MSLTKMMACWSIRNVLDLYVDARLSPSALKRAGGHLAACEDCRRVERSLRPVRVTKGSIAPPPGLADAIVKQFESQAEPRPLIYSLRLAPSQAAALVYLGLLAAGHALPGTLHQGPPERPHQGPMNTGTMDAGTPGEGFR